MLHTGLLAHRPRASNRMQALRNTGESRAKNGGFRQFSALHKSVSSAKKLTGRAKPLNKIFQPGRLRRSA